MRRVWAILGVAMVLMAALPSTAVETALVVIVHPDRPSRLSRDEVAKMYLKKRRFWDDGAPIVPINREPGNSTREVFSHRVLGGASGDFAAYWNQQYFSGIFPPATLSSSAAVKRYVATERNAIGYIDGSEVDDSVRVVLHLQ